VPVSGTELTPRLRISTQLSKDLVDASPHGLLILQRRLGLCLERAKIALPVEAKAERRVEDAAGMERKL